MKKFELKKIIKVLSLLFLFSFGFTLVYSQEYCDITVYPYDCLPEDAIDYKTENGEKKFSEEAIEFLREYMGGLLMLPGDKVSKNFFDGPELVYHKDILEAGRGDVKGWICEEQENSEESRFTSDSFCTNVNFEFLERFNEPNSTTIESGGEICSTVNIENSEYAVFGEDKKDYIIPFNEDRVVITSRYGDTANRDYVHQGVDWGVIGDPKNIQVLAANNAKVLKRWDNQKNYGMSLILEHDFGGKKEYTLYAHMSELNVSEGDTVAMGDQIGRVGSTGNSTGPHLHFEIRRLPFQWDGDCLTNPNKDCISNVDPEPRVETGRVKIDELRAKATGEQIEICQEVEEGEEIVTPIDYPARNASVSCLMDKAASAVGNVPREALYAIAKHESASGHLSIGQFQCPPLWEMWATWDRNPILDELRDSGVNVPDLRDVRICTGDPRQIAFASSNWVALRRTVGGESKPVDVRGFTQFAAGRVPESYANTFNNVVKDASMQECVEALGIGNTLPKDIPDAELSAQLQEFGFSATAIDPYSEDERYSRHVMGHMICATAIKLRNDAGNIPVENWTPDTLRNVAIRYHGSCEGEWNVYCTEAQRFFEEAEVNPEVFECVQR